MRRNEFSNAERHTFSKDKAVDNGGYTCLGMSNVNDERCALSGSETELKFITSD